VNGPAAPNRPLVNRPTLAEVPLTGLSLLARAVIVERPKEATDEVVFGSTVVVKDLKFGDKEVFILVGAGEEDYDAGKINVASPLAQGLLGRKVGEKVSIDVPAGTMKFEILEVKFDD
jgi:transcription elongation factor GreA